MEPKIKETAWNPELEKQILKQWQDSHIYDFKPEGDVFVIDTPPPYPSGRPWHVGAAAHYAQIDMIARTCRMLGHEVYFPIGIDRNGMPVELYTERKHKVSFYKLPREKFIELCRSSLDELEAEMLQIMRKMGLSADFKQYYRTDSREYRTLTQSTFIKLWNRGMIYSSNRPNNYCVDCRTTLADADIVYEELPTKLVHMR